MKQLIDAVKQLEGTTNRSEKIYILICMKDNELFKKTLEYTYNPYKVYGVGTKTLSKMEQMKTTPIQNKFNDIFELLDFLSMNNLNNVIENDVACFLQSVSDDATRDLYIRMLSKDLKCGISDKTINGVFDNLIPTFNVMLAKKYEDHIEKLKGREFIITTKLDGIRAVVIKDNFGVVKIYTRQGKIIEGCVDIEDDMKKVPNGIVLDGEFLKENPEKLSSKELYNATKKITGKKGLKTGLEYHVFDYLSLEDFQLGKSTIPTHVRKDSLKTMIEEAQLKHIINVPVLYRGTDISMIDYYSEEAVKNEQEGVMVNIANAPYECKRSSNILKVKKFNECDLQIIGFQEGEGKHRKALGALIVDYKGYRVGVGTGLSDTIRKEFWKHREKYLGRVVTVKYFEESSDEKGNISLRFPVFVELREEGKEVSYN